MCSVCIKRAIAREIVEVESRIQDICIKLEKDNINYSNDREFIRLADCLSDLFGKYEELV
jgi:hypothetical protein